VNSWTLSLALALSIAGCAHPTPPTAAPTQAADHGAPAMTSDNPFANPSTLPYELPPFADIRFEHYAPAMDAGMVEQLAEVSTIASNPQAPSFENTVVALERTGGLLNRAQYVFWSMTSSYTSDELQELEAEYAPKLAAHSDAILLNDALFKRVDVVFQQRDALGLDPESAQLLKQVHGQFVRAGAKLSGPDKARLMQINEELSSLSTDFVQTVLKATKDGAVVVDDVAELDGLSDSAIAGAADVAKERGLDGKWVLTLQNTTIQPVLEQLTNRALRERVFRASSARGQGEGSDNTAGVVRAVALRAEKASLLGYPNYAAYSLEDETAKTPEAVNAMLAKLGPAALAKAREEAADIQAIIDAEAKAAGAESFELQPWDWAFYAAKVRKERYDFDEAQVKPYFDLNHVYDDGVFFAAGKLYGITFKERKDLVAYAPDVRVFEVFEANGDAVGLFLLDVFRRDNKQGGAWMSSFVDQSGLLGKKPVIVNNLNVAKPADGQPVLLTFDEVTTAFHEFGHALHGLLSDARYPTLAGTNTPRDFVEYPSQLNEMWAREPQVLANYAKHYQTGEPMPDALFQRVLTALTFDQGYATTEYLEAAMLDQAWHQIPLDQVPKASEVMSFEVAALDKAGMTFAPVPPRYHTSYFAHTFGGGYSAGYYAYIWSEVLARDTGAWFHAHGGLSREAGDVVRAKILSRGHTDEPSALFEALYGGPPEIEPLLEYRGLTLPK